MKGGEVREPFVIDCTPDTDTTVITEEATVGAYDLPDPLIFDNGELPW